MKKDKDLYQQKKQAQLDGWKAEIDKLKARASGASADIQLELNRHIKELEARIKENKAKLSELARTGEDAWDSVKENVESSWDSMKSRLSEAAAKFRK